MHSSLANDTAVTAEEVGKSLTAAAVVREYGGSGAGSLAETEFRPSTVSTASGDGREAASDQREPRARLPIAPPICDGRRRTMRWRKSSRIDPAIAADGKAGDWALTRVKYYTIPIYPGHGGRRRPTWERQGERNVGSERLCTRTT